MFLSDTAIKRPVVATVLSLLIVVFGVATLLQLEVREYPDIDASVVSVSTSYPGAAPEVIDAQITEVIESAVSGVEGIRTIESNSRLGRGRTTIEFSRERDVDNAANDVRDGVSRVLDRLPDEADPPEIAKVDADARPMMWLTLTSDRMSPEQLSDYAERNLQDRLAILDGVAETRIGGQRRYAMRIWLDRRQMAAREVGVNEVTQALQANNVELPGGRIRSAGREFTVRADSRLNTAEAFRDLVIAVKGDGRVRLGDIARVEMGVEDKESALRTEGRTAIGLGIIRQSRANTVAVSDRVQQAVSEIQPTLPDGVALATNYDESLFIRASTQQVLITLGIAGLLVILVIFVFLRTLRATLIPAVTIPVALIGAFIGLGIMGFSINVLTLLALILAIGLVVDDAIVMLENIQRRLDNGEPRLVAAWRGARQVAFAIIATTVTLIAVFVPIAFMGGNVGRLFGEFALTLAAAVTVSSLVALTLAPMLCSAWLRPSGQASAGHPWRQRLDHAFDGLNRGYERLLRSVLDRPWPLAAIAAVAIALAGAIFPNLGRELAPVEDRGVFMVNSSAPQGATAEYTSHHVAKVEDILQPLVDNGEAQRVLSIIGFRGRPDNAFTIVRLAPWSERSRSQQEIVSALRPELARVAGLRVNAISPPGLGQSGFSQPLEAVIGGPDYDSVDEWSARVLELARENPGLRDLDRNLELTQPQLNVEIDRELAAEFELSARDIGLSLQAMFASLQTTRYMDRGREYDVIMEAAREDRSTPADLAGLFLRTGDGERLVPLAAMVELEESGASPELRRVGRLPGVRITGGLEDDYDLGTALDDIRDLVSEELPTDARLTFTGLSREFSEASTAIYITFALALLVVFLVLAAQFESWIHPLIIMLSVPLAVAGALASLAATGITLNIYSQIGMIMLMGLMAKNGILVVEFANQLRDQGYSVADAALQGAILRFRPVLMTTISTVFGAIPLVLAVGAGAESRMAIGVVIMGGLVFATAMTLFIIPVLYRMLAGFTGSVGRVARALNRELDEATERM